MRRQTNLCLLVQCFASSLCLRACVYACDCLCIYVQAYKRKLYDYDGNGLDDNCEGK